MVKHGGNVFAFSRNRGWDWHDVLDFSASINPLGPAPGVSRAICAAVDRIVHYPEREPAILQQALSKTWQVPASCVMTGNGATELLHFFARVRRFSHVTLAAPAFSEFHRAYPKATLVDAARSQTWPDSGLFVLTQPANPTGHIFDPEWLESYLRATSHAVLVDESFLDFTGLRSMARLIEERPLLYVLRSLTKFYALPGLRLGALLAAREEIERLQTYREPWQVNVLAEAAVLAALDDPHHTARTIEFVNSEREWLCTRINELDRVSCQPSAANYLWTRLDYPAAPLARFLEDRRILIRDCTGWPGLPAEPSVRVAVRTRAENEVLLAAWKEFPCAS